MRISRFLFFAAILLVLASVVSCKARQQEEHNEDERDNLYQDFGKLKQDPYVTLGLTREATLPQIKKAYKLLALKTHPDKNKEPGAAEKFDQIQQAYEILVDPAKRESYEQFASDYFFFSWTEDGPKIHLVLENDVGLGFLLLTGFFALTIFWCCCGRRKRRNPVARGREGSKDKAPQLVAAGLVTRMIAGAIDVVFWFLISLMIQLAKVDESEIDANFLFSALTGSEIMLVWLFGGTTVGHRLFGIKVVSSSGSRVGFFGSFTRIWAKYVMIILVPIFAFVIAASVFGNDEENPNYWNLLWGLAVIIIPFLRGRSPWDYVAGTKVVQIPDIEGKSE